MTTSKRTEKARRRAPVEADSVRELFAREMRILGEQLGSVRCIDPLWPDPAWQDRPIEWVETFLGIDLYDRQREILEACHDHRRVAVRSNNKAGKTTVLAAGVLWFAYSFHRARAILMADTEKQVGGALYHEIRRLYAGSGRCLPCSRRAPNGPRPCPHSRILDGVKREDPGTMARTGLKFEDGREIVGFSGGEAEAVAGLSSPNLLVVFDEASGRNFDRVYEGIVGNMAGGGRLWIISNPTRTRGQFHAIFHSSSSVYHCLHVSAFDSPNVKAGRTVVAGLADQQFIDDAREEFGERSPFYRARVLGEFPEAEEGAIFTLEDLEAAVERDEKAKADGPLRVGVDVAGETGTGDESAFAVRRGPKILALHARRGLTPDGHVAEVLGIIANFGNRAEKPRVLIDIEGEPGAKVWGAFLAYVEGHRNPQTGEPPFELVGVRASERAQREPKTYDRVRDELVGCLAAWVRDGGALPKDGKLAAELVTLRWIPHPSGRTKLLGKDKIREIIGRSPDRADAVALCTWEFGTIGAVAAATSSPQPDAHEARTDRVFDPYGADRAFRR